MGNSHFPRELPRSSESTNLSRDNLSREIGRRVEREDDVLVDEINELATTTTEHHSATAATLYYIATSHRTNAFDSTILHHIRIMPVVLIKLYRIYQLIYVHIYNIRILCT